MYLKCLHFTFIFESHFCWIQNSRLVGLASFPSPFRPSFLLLYSSVGCMPLCCLLLVLFPVRNLIFIPWYAMCFSLWLNLSFLYNWFWAIWLCLGIGHFPSYFWYLGLPGLLDLWIQFSSSLEIFKPLFLQTLPLSLPFKDSNYVHISPLMSCHSSLLFCSFF